MQLEIIINQRIFESISSQCENSNLSKLFDKRIPIRKRLYGENFPLFYSFSHHILASLKSLAFPTRRKEGSDVRKSKPRRAKQCSQESRGVSFLESRSPLPSERDKGRPNRGRRIDYHLAAWRQGKSAGIKLKYDDRC